MYILFINSSRTSFFFFILMLNLIIIIIIVVVVVVVVVVVITKKKNVVQPMSSKVLKPEPDRMVRSGKPQTAHFCGSFRLKNRSMGKK